jgi:hypothetical protein
VEREATLLILCLALWWPLCAVGAALVRPSTRFATSGRIAESAMWWRLWAPLVPATIGILVAIGWALQAPDMTDDALDVALLIAALPGAWIAARTATRGLRALATPNVPLAATVGLLRPRVVVDPRLATVLDRDELEAVHAHEAAHARHRDPLRIWVAQLAMDLQWPAPSARDRFHHWMHALELARDEEARELGVEGASLASAVVNVAKLSRGHAPTPAALVGHGMMLRDRIGRLLGPLVRADQARRTLLAFATMTVLAAAITTGIVGGDHVLRLIPGVREAL